MRNIWRIFIRDVRQSTRNVIAIIVAMGLVIVPALYAWYNIAASWDPYGNTKSLKVAVANVDKGYKSDLIPVEINVGETVVSALRANHDLDWQFVDRDKAIDGVNSGDYYAALVIPKSFSADMMTLFSSEVKHAKLEYYLNEKINPVSSHITDEGASTVATTIDQTFMKTISSVALNLASNVADYAQSPQMSQYVSNATGHITTMASRLQDAAGLADSYAGLIGAATTIIDTTDKLLGSTGSSGSSGEDIKKALQQGRDTMSDLDAALAGATSGINTALGQASAAYDDIAKQIDKAFDGVGGQTSQVTGKLTDLQGRVQSQADAYGQYASALRSLAQSASSQAVRDALNTAADQVDATQGKLADAARAIGDAVTKINNGTADVDAARKDLAANIASAKQSVTQVADTYANTLKPQLDDLASSMSDVVSQTNTVIDGLSAVVNDVSGMSGDISDALAGAQSTLADVSGKLGASADKLNDLGGKLQSLTGSAGSADLSSITSADPDTIATLLSAPVSIDRVAVYPMENYGSSMTSFYTVLSIWVGAIVLAAMLKVSVSDHEKAKILRLGNTLPLGEETGLREAVIVGRAAGPAAMLDVLRKPRAESPGNARRFGLRLHQEYFGRYMTFAAFALLQGTLVCLGDLLFLGVQCEHPLQFMMVGWLSALVFSNIVYTLTVSFGDIGKAVAVVLLVMQVAGSGGTYPIETLPKFFQIVSRWLLFPHAIDAMQSSMAGAYGMEYWASMGKLALFLIPSLLLGLVLRKPVIRFNNWIIRNLESTKVM